jgi:apolipoprotein N-acyltransferase
MLKMLGAALSGLLLTAAFPRPGLEVLAAVALVPLLAALRDCGPGKALRLGLLAGWVHYGTLLYWVVPFLETFAHFPLYAAVPVQLLLSVVLALFMALFGAGTAVFGATAGRLLLWVPVSWTALEYMRNFFLSGFPWELLGYSLYERPQWIQIADLCGVYGVSFLLAAVNAAILVVVLGALRLPWQGRSVGGAVVLAALLLPGALAGATWFYGVHRLATVDTLIAARTAKTVVAVQGNVSQHLKWAPKLQKATVDKYLRLSTAAAGQRPHLVVWPETATPFYFPYEPELSHRVLEGVTRIGTHFLIGSPAFVPGGKEGAYFNSAYLIEPGGAIVGRYDKTHLVPFGEYVPSWMPFVDKIVAEVGEFSVGDKGRVLVWGEERIGMLICYEVIFPELARAVAANGASLLVNITNDAWYGRSNAPYQHFTHAVLRAVEARRALVRCANTGITGFIDPSGRILARTDLFVDAALSRPVPLLDVETFYVRYGDWLAMGCLVLTALGWVGGLWRLRKR